MSQKKSVQLGEYVMHNLYVGPNGLHIEAPGCVINIRGGLVTHEGRVITSIDIIADQFIGEDEWKIVTVGEPNTTYLNVQLMKQEDSDA